MSDLSCIRVPPLGLLLHQELNDSFKDAKNGKSPWSLKSQLMGFSGKVTAEDLSIQLYSIVTKMNSPFAGK